MADIRKCEARIEYGTKSCKGWYDELGTLHDSCGEPCSFVTDNPPIPTPGSPTAIHQGCTCPRIDNHHGWGMPYPNGPRFVIVENCPLHWKK